MFLQEPRRDKHPCVELMKRFLHYFLSHNKFQHKKNHLYPSLICKIKSRFRIVIMLIFPLCTFQREALLYLKLRRRTGRKVRELWTSG